MKVVDSNSLQLKHRVIGLHRSPLMHDIRSQLPLRMYFTALAWRWLVVLLTV